MKIAIILGTRPEIIKMSPVIRQLEKKKINFFILHTNQHFDKRMDKIFFDELNLPKPKYNLNIKEKTHGKMTGEMIIKIEDILIKEKPDWVLIEGDTNTILAGAIAASKLGIKIGHVEAGLRSYDRTMPEELNRIVADHLSDALFAPTQKQVNILKEEGIDPKKIFLTGNTIVDAVYQNLDLAQKKYRKNKDINMKYFLLTLHRPSNVDNKEKLTQLINTLIAITKKYKTRIIFPVHPRTKKMLLQFSLKLDPTLIEMIEPVGYLQMLLLEKNSQLILTDSGGLQEEACILHVPCVTLRDNTERPETLAVGANILAGTDRIKIIAGIETMLFKKRVWINPFGDGKAAEKIVHSLSI